VEGRMFLDPTKANESDITILTRIYTRPAMVQKIAAHFSKYFTNRTAVVHMEHVGDLGMEVKVSAKVDFSQFTNTDNLVLYVYNPTTNTYKKLANQWHVIDANGYFWFKTSMGGDIIISDGALVRK